MQNKYVGDVGDYGKYGLLRSLFSKDDSYRLGVVWYLVPDEAKKTDGEHIKYLSNKHKDYNRNCDSELLDELNNIICSGNRDIKQIERANIFKPATVCFSQLLSFDGTNANSPKGIRRRVFLRNKWFESALEVTKNCNVLFLDPDNGIESPGIKGKKHLKVATKYAFLDEIERLVSMSNVVVVYHHLGRPKGGHKLYIQKLKSQLQQRFAPSTVIYGLRFRPYSPRAYFIIANEARKCELELKIHSFLHSPWKKCFELMD